MNSTMAQKIVLAAQPYLEGKTVTDMVIGLSLVACQLSDGSVGVTYTLKDNLPKGGCGAFSYTQNVIGAPAKDIAQWFCDGRDDIQRAIADCVLTAASQSADIENDDGMFGMTFTEDDVVGMIGMIAPVAFAIKDKVKDIIVFDKGKSSCGGDMYIYPMEMQPVLLPKCTKLIFSGTTTINGSIDELLEMCKNVPEIAIIGASTPMFTKAFENTNVKVLAGSWWKKEYKEEIFKEISLAGGLGRVKKYMTKKAAKV